MCQPVFLRFSQYFFCLRKKIPRARADFAGLGPRAHLEACFSHGRRVQRCNECGRTFYRTCSARSARAVTAQRPPLPSLYFRRFLIDACNFVGLTAIALDADMGYPVSIALHRQLGFAGFIGRTVCRLFFQRLKRLRLSVLWDDCDLKFPSVTGRRGGDQRDKFVSSRRCHWEIAWACLFRECWKAHQRIL